MNNVLQYLTNCVLVVFIVQSFHYQFGQDSTLAFSAAIIRCMRMRYFYPSEYFISDLISTGWIISSDLNMSDYSQTPGEKKTWFKSEA